MEPLKYGTLIQQIIKPTYDELKKFIIKLILILLDFFFIINFKYKLFKI